jgi:hypothetical protein
MLAPPPSVTSVTSTFGQHAPAALPSVTSIPNFRPVPHTARPFHNGHFGRNGFAGGFAYAIPYYYDYPLDNSAYGYDYMGNGGPDLYSGPPPGGSDPTLHIVVEQPPARPYEADVPGPQAYAAPPAPPAKLPDDKPGDPTVLVFRNGHQQTVNSYAIMDDSLYVFDQGRKTIALNELDIPATIKANDDRGVEFRLPPAIKKKASMTITVPADQAPASTPKNTASTTPGAVPAMP